MFKLSYSTAAKLKGESLKNISILLLGTGLAQLIPILASPLLTRIYTPTDFGLLGLFTSITTILIVFASARLDLAILEPKIDEDSAIVVKLSKNINLIFCLFLLIIITIFHERIVYLLEEPLFKNWLYIIPVAVFITTNISIYNNWFVRFKNFKYISTSKIVNSVFNICIALVLGYFFQLKGLIIGYVIGQLFAYFYFLIKTNKAEKIVIDFKKSFKRVFQTYNHYTYYLIPATLLSELALSLPIILFAKYFSLEVSGLFALAFRITMLPSSLLGNSIGEVYRQKAFEHYNKFGNCLELFKSSFKNLVLIGIVPLLILVFFSKILFVFFFGEQWLQAGVIAQYMSVLVFFNLISVPLSYSILLNKSQKVDMVLQFIRLLLVVGAFYIGYQNSQNWLLTVKLYVGGFTIFYILHSFVQYRAAKGLKSYW